MHKHGLVRYARNDEAVAVIASVSFSDVILFYFQQRAGAPIWLWHERGHASLPGPLKPEAKTIRLLEKRYGHEITEIFGINPAALTANEASYLVGFRTADEIRNRLAKARQETHLRLRSKGIGPTDQGQAGS